ncbi:hypothetical protein KO525_01380 [Psychrosphaera sp. B3R10]|uniref:hypothetical protein n=1 Tax=unclassified Psychrosphaera TaxID=2641570 RepID=UPI001C084C01|nr:MULTISPECIES: hypothetical protein [unclassified Psychrosphaera]MBU2882814.1 hypothetical protein [Psychrosphaera sp. I2R16]MBU2988036.1 hypothetical protein [Psychrosphaera sp. B3R10]
MFVDLFAGLFLMFCVYMAYAPHAFSIKIISFSQWRYFHPFEIVARLIAGLLFLSDSVKTTSPLIINLIAFGFIGVGIGLFMIGEKRHRAFANWSADKFRPYFRVIGLTCWPFAIWLFVISG